MATLNLENVAKSYRKRVVVNRVSLELNQREIVGLLGPNGAGKTTTFHIAIGLTRPDSGKVLIDDLDITKFAIHKRARVGISYLPQEPSVFHHLSTEENILAILETLNLSKKERMERLFSLLDELGIKHLARQKVYTLSGGERRRCEIARVLVTSPTFMLLDEPFTGIDPLTVTQIQGIINTLKERGLGILITDHRVRETLEITDRAYIIYQGEILFQGDSKELIEDPKTREVYLGKDFKLE